MDHKSSSSSSSSKYLESPPFSHSHGQQQGMRKGNPFVDTSSSSSSDFVSSFPLPLPVANNHIKHGPAGGGYNKRNNIPNTSNSGSVVEAPSTPGRPVFSFSIVGNYNQNNTTTTTTTRKKLVPSKWNDAEKWLVSDTTQQNHHHLDGFAKSADFVSRKSSSGSSRIHHHPKGISSEQKLKDHHNNLSTASSSSDSFNVVVKDKFTNELKEPNLLTLAECKCLEPLSESFLFKEAAADLEVEEISSRDIGTEMTPLGSSTTSSSRCPTPFKTMSPPRHNTPAATRSGPLSVMDPTLDMAELQGCHLAKLRLLQAPFDSSGVSGWTTREEEEEDISKSLRHFEMSNECRKSISESRACAWEEEEKTKCCLRYQREDAKIQAWVDLQNAKAEAESRKLEVKIQKLRSKFEEKLMRKMADVHRKAEELRAAAQLEHTEQMQKAKEQVNKTINQRHLNVHFSGCSCSCFPCNTNIHHS